MHHVDVLIVGNGVLGLSTAYALALSNSTLKIGLLGPSDMRGSATAAAGAMLGCFGEVTYKSLDTPIARKKLEMNIQASKMWGSWIQELNGHIDKQFVLSINPGTFVILNTNSGEVDDANYTAILSALETYKEPYELVEPSEIFGLNPLDTSRPLRSLYLPNEGAINPDFLLRALRNFAEKCSNIHLFDDAGKKIALSPEGEISYFETEQGTIIQTKRVVLAAGSYSQKFIDQIPEIKNRIPRLLCGVGYSLLIQHNQTLSPHVIRTPNRSLACGLHFVPRGMNEFYVGATNNMSQIPETMAPIGYTHFLLTCLQEQIHQGLHTAKISGLITGNRPVTIDTFPLIGETSIPGLWLLTGTYRDGLHCAPLLSQYIANQILGSKTELFENPFLPERSPIQIFTREEAITEATRHYMAGAYEHNLNLPKIGWYNMFEDMLRKKFEELYRDLDVDFVMSPDLVLAFEQDRETYIKLFKEEFK